jgi:hypothetical protein
MMNDEPSKKSGILEAKCEFCGETAMYICEKCRHSNYCSKKCRKSHWRKHKSLCEAIAETIAFHEFNFKDIDWLIWEPVDSAHYYAKDGSLKPISQSMWDQRIDNKIPHSKGDTVTLHLSVRRFECDYKTIELTRPFNTRYLLNAIFAFYNTPLNVVDKQWILEVFATKNNSVDEYITTVVSKINEGLDVRWIDMVGTDFLMSTEIQRRVSNLTDA